ncbi:MAG: ComEC/Rec2 family competence protein [Leucobacter sp.]
MSAVLIHVPGTGRIVVIVTATAGVVACVWSLVQKRTTAAVGRPMRVKRNLGILLISCAVMLCVSVQIDVAEQARAAPALTSAADGARTVSVSASLSGFPSSSDGFDGIARGWVRASVSSVDGAQVSQRVPFMLWLPSVAPELWFPGTEVTATGRLERAPPESRTAYEMQVTHIEAVETTNDVSSWLGVLAATLRTHLRTAAEQQSGAELVPGFAVGDTSLVGEELEALMLESSLSHLVAVSGANCALVVGAVVALVSRLRGGRRLRMIIAVGGLLLFVVLVGPDPSVQRASIMAGVMLLSGFGGKRGKALPALGLAVILLLAADPWQSVQPGFALSVVATGGILLWTPSVERWLRLTMKFPRVLALPLAVACVAQFACAPMLLLLQPGLALGGIVANLIAAPAAPAGTAIGMLAMLALPLHEGLGNALVWCATWPARWVEAAGTLSVTLPLARLYWPGGWGGALLLGTVQVLAYVVLMIRSGSITARNGENLSRVHPWRLLQNAPLRLRMLSQVLAGLAAGVIVALVIVVPATVRLGVPRDWAVVSCDVGQGDATLLRDPRDPETVILVDTGDDREKLNACLDLFGVDRITLLILTHDDRDHVGAASAVLPRSSRVLIAPASEDQQADRPLVAQIEESGMQPKVGSAGMKGGSELGLRWQVIGPETEHPHEDTNAASLVLMVHISGTNILLLGDTGDPEQRWLRESYPQLSAEIVKVAHHGSKDQAAGYYRAVAPNLALVSVGENRYGHPNRALLDELRGIGAAVLRTDTHGSIAITLNPSGEIDAWSAGSVGANG